jgi:hypothetical protein
MRLGWRRRRVLLRSHGTAQAARYGHDLWEKAIFALKTTPRNDDERL